MTPEEYALYCKEAEAEAKAEYLSYDSVYTSIHYVRFASRSKGRRNGKKRLRKHWKEVHLVRYNNGWHYWHNFQFDVYATEIIGQYADGELLKDRIIQLWGY